jgi:AcrR family transcriptional regulator
MATDTVTERAVQRRGPVVRSAILDATLQLIVEHGYGFSIDEVAARSHVHKTTVYRNWPTKPTLVAAAIDELASTTIDLTRTNDAVADLERLAVSVARTLRTTAGTQAIRAVVAAAADDADLIAAARSFLTGRYHHATAIIDDAVATGQMRHGIDPTLVWEAIVNPLHMRAILGTPATDATARRLVAQTLDGTRR